MMIGRSHKKVEDHILIESYARHQSVWKIETRQKFVESWKRGEHQHIEEELMARTIKSFKTKLEKYGRIAPINPNVTWKQGWREIGGKREYYRSRWEANYARYLQWQKEHGLIKDWLHEPKTFWFENIKRGSVTYLPDFKVINLDGTYFWVEVKGWMDARSKTKIKRFRKYFPEEKLILLDGKWYKANQKNLSLSIPLWEP